MGSQLDSPAVALAKRITARLEREELLDVTPADKFVDSLATGKLRESDWKFAVEVVPKAPKKSSKKR
jgi:hypothetical protein